MDLKPKKELTDEDVRIGLKLVIGDGLAAEAMTTFTGGAFLVAMALLMGASNFADRCARGHAYLHQYFPVIIDMAGKEV